MPSCSVYGCLHTSINNPELAFFKLPVDVVRRAAWLRLISREDLMDRKPLCYVVCQAHFEQRCIILTTNRKLLKKDAMPSLHLPNNESPTQISIVSILTRSNAFTQTDSTSNNKHITTNFDKCIKYNNVQCNYEVSDVRACRICLNTNVKLYKLDNHHLKQYYEEVMSAKLDIRDGLPNYFCYECAAMLHKFHKFKEKCHRGDKLLNELLWNGCITIDEILNTDREFHKLKSLLDILIVNQRVKTCLVKRETIADNIIEDLQEIDTPQLPKMEQIDPDNNIIEADHDENVIEVNIIDEQKRTKGDEQKKDTDESVVENINIDADLISDDEKTDSEVQNALSAEEEPAIREMIQRKANIDKDSQIDEKKSQANNKADQKCEIIDQYGIKKKNRGGRRKKYKVPDRSYLDPKYWLKFHLSEEEARVEFEARAQDPKYLKAAYQCFDCYRGFSQEEMLVRHNKLLHAESKGEIVCRFCKMRFKWNCHLTRHIVQHYTRFKCLRCDLISPLLMGAVLHNDYHNGVTKRCPHCGEEFKHNSTYYTHLRMSHRSSHVCTQCGASFVSAAGLRQHRRIKHVTEHIAPGEEAKLHCERCEVTFETRAAYEAHMYHSAKHEEAIEDGRPVTAPKMRRPGVSRDTRRRREYITCTICGKRFPTYPVFVRHHTAQHPDTAVPAREHVHKPTQQQKYTDRHICEICGISISYGNMGTHLNRHTREKHYDCRTCGRQFNSRTGLNNHQASHSSERRVQCPLCDKRFKQRVSMKLHYRTAHLKQPYPKRNRNKKKEESKLDDYIHSGADGVADSFNSKYFFH